MDVRVKCDDEADERPGNAAIQCKDVSGFCTDSKKYSLRDGKLADRLPNSDVMAKWLMAAFDRKRAEP